MAHLAATLPPTGGTVSAAAPAEGPDGRSAAQRYLIGYHEAMIASELVQRVRNRAGLSLRELGRRAGTSHSTLSAYEAGRKVPTVDTLDRIVRAAGFVAGIDLEPDVGGPDRTARGRELVEVLDLAAMFPARHAPTLDYPRFGAS